MQSAKTDKPAAQTTGLFSAVVIVAALGYFVDIYDLILFSIVRVASLKELGVTAPEQVTSQGLFLINMQMGGMLLGGILWGILGDRRGRLSVLFGSILLYSLANLANGFVQTIDQYAWLRLVAGIGLAGELGAGITLVSESLPKEKRGYGTMIVATVGVSGAMLAYWVGEQLGWRNAYFVGGGLGLALLLLRVSVIESGMFQHVQAQAEVRRGDFFSLFTHGPRLSRYLRCLLIGVPLWFVIGILITLAPEFGRAMQLQGEVTAGLGVFWSYFGLVFGDFASGALSQLWRSRNRALKFFLGFCAALVAVYLYGLKGATPTTFYIVCFVLGVSVGFWALFVTVAAEQFGTNLRATVATTAPNFARGSVLLLVPVFQWLTGPATQPRLGLLNGAAVLGGVSLLVAFWAVSTLPESYGKDLDYVEE